MKKVFTVNEVPGARRQTNAEYTAALIGEFDHDRNIARWENPENGYYKNENQNYDYRLNVSKSTINDVQFRFSDRVTYYTQTDIDEAKKFIDANPDKAAYIEKLRLQSVEHAKKNKAQNDGEIIVLSWASRADLAEKRKSEFAGSYKNLKVVPTVRVK